MGDPTTSPELQDINILNDVDYATVIALKRTYLKYVSEGNQSQMDACLRAIEEIRRKSEYKGKYSSSDASGFAVSGYSYFSDKVTSNVVVHAHTITKQNRLAHDETVVNTGAAVVGLIIPKPYAVLVNVIASTATNDGAPPAIDDVALIGLGLQDGVKGYFFTGLGLVNSQNKRKVQLGDIEVVLSMQTNKGMTTTNSQYLFNNEMELKREIYWKPVTVNPRFGYQIEKDWKYD